jgi:hypothetical protein
MHLRSRTLSQGPEIQRVQQAVAPIVAPQPTQPTTPPADTQGQGQVILVPASTVARNVWGEWFTVTSTGMNS